MLDISLLQIDSNYLSQEFIKDYIETLTWVGGLFWVMIFLPIYYLVQCRAINVFKKLYPDEKIEYVLSSGIIFTVTVTYLLGVAFWGDIMPFVIFKNLQVAGRVHVNEFLFYLILHVFFIWLMLARVAIIYVFSDKRIKTILTFYKIPEKLKIKNNILYKDIESILFYDYPICKNLDITFKDKRKLRSISCMGHMRQAKDIVLRYIDK